MVNQAITLASSDDDGPMFFCIPRPVSCQLLLYLLWNRKQATWESNVEIVEAQERNISSNVYYSCGSCRSMQ